MSNLVEIGKIGELNDGEKKGIITRGVNILLTRSGDKYLATDCVCTHAGGYLTTGVLKDTVITCPWHGSQFGLVDGNPVRWLKTTGLLLKLRKAVGLAKPLRTYRVIIDQGSILVEL